MVPEGGREDRHVTPTPSSSAPAWPAWSPPPSWPTPGAASCSTRSRRQSLGRAGVLVARRALPGGLAGAAPDGDPRLARAGVAGLAGDRRLRPRGGPLAAALGRGVRGLRRGGEAAWLRERGSASSPWSGGRSAAATRPGHGNSVPRFHLTWGTGSRRGGAVRPRVREAGARGLVSLPLPPPRDGAHRHRRGGGRRPRRGAGAERRRRAARPARAEVAASSSCGRRR
jgi:hypothetical protein